MCPNFDWTSISNFKNLMSLGDTLGLSLKKLKKDLEDTRKSEKEIETI